MGSSLSLRLPGRTEVAHDSSPCGVAQPVNGVMALWWTAMMSAHKREFCGLPTRSDHFLHLSGSKPGGDVFGYLCQNTVGTKQKLNTPTSMRAYVLSWAAHSDRQNSEAGERFSEGNCAICDHANQPHPTAHMHHNHGEVQTKVQSPGTTIGSDTLG